MNNFLPVKDNDGKDSGELDNDVETGGEIRSRNLEKFLGDDEVTGAGNREEFGKTLDKGEDDGLEICHKLLYDEDDVVFKEKEKKNYYDC